MRVKQNRACGGIFEAHMRVVAGRFRGRSIVAPEGSGTRPILDRAKVALFDWLGSRLAMPGVLPPIAVLDLFCGGGSLGIESLSRGAAFVTFVDAGRAAVAALRSNIDQLKISATEARVVPGAVEAAVIPVPPTGAYDLIFLDPPYRLTPDQSPGSTLDRLLRRLGDDIHVAGDALLIWRHEIRHQTPERIEPGWTCIERRAWGHVAITAYERDAVMRSASVQGESALNNSDHGVAAGHTLGNGTNPPRLTGGEP